MISSNWTLITSTADWNARSDHTSVMLNNKIFVMGGDIYDGSSLLNYLGFSDWYCRLECSY